MTDRGLLQRAAQEAGFGGAVAGVRRLSGGCIHDVRLVSLDDGAGFVAKIGRAADRAVFEEEAAGLRALCETGTVLAPEPLAVLAEAGGAVLAMTALSQGRADRDTWSRFGRELAALHAAPAPGARGYGFETDNHLGATPQPNTWCDDWVEFNARHRLGHQLDLARGRSLLSSHEAARVQRVIDRLSALLPAKPRPALLHGDLWSGNALPAEDAGRPRVAVIDPACSYGDGWADIAMMRLFGGFPESCFASYANAAGEPEHERRIAVYQLYHLLNHVNLFGRGYVGQAMGLAAALDGTSGTDGGAAQRRSRPC